MGLRLCYLLREDLGYVRGWLLTGKAQRILATQLRDTQHSYPICAFPNHFKLARLSLDSKAPGGYRLPGLALCMRSPPVDPSMCKQLQSRAHDTPHGHTSPSSSPNGTDSIAWAQSRSFDIQWIEVYWNRTSVWRSILETRKLFGSRLWPGLGSRYDAAPTACYIGYRQLYQADLNHSQALWSALNKVRAIPPARFGLSSSSVLRFLTSVNIWSAFHRCLPFLLVHLH